MAAISTRYIPPTNTKPARVKAWRTGHKEGPSVTVDFHGDATLPGEPVQCPHARAAWRLVLKLDPWFHGRPWFLAVSTDDQRGYLFAVNAAGSATEFIVPPQA